MNIEIRKYEQPPAFLWILMWILLGSSASLMGLGLKWSFEFDRLSWAVLTGSAMLLLGLVVRNYLELRREQADVSFLLQEITSTEAVYEAVYRLSTEVQKLYDAEKGPPGQPVSDEVYAAIQKSKQRAELRFERFMDLVHERTKLRFPSLRQDVIAEASVWLRDHA